MESLELLKIQLMVVIIDLKKKRISNFFKNFLQFLERKNGPAGIMRGMGKGCLGLFVKPIGSLFDGVSLSLDGIKRISQSGSEKTENIRLPRHLIEKSVCT